MQLAPIVYTIGQPEDFSELLDDIQYEFRLTGLNWQSYRVKRYIADRLKESGFHTTSLDAAINALSSENLAGLLKLLRTPEVVQMSEPGAFDVSRKTCLGNPFPMQFEAQRDAVCDAHKRFLWELHKSRYTLNPRTLAETIAPQFGLKVHDRYHAGASEISNTITYLCSVRGRQEKLGCYCSPKRCHGDNIAALVSYILNTDK